MELPAKLLDYFLWSNKSNTNQSRLKSVLSELRYKSLCDWSTHHVTYVLYALSTGFPVCHSPTKGFVLPSWQEKIPKGTSGPLYNTKWVSAVNLLSEYIYFFFVNHRIYCLFLLQIPLSEQVSFLEYRICFYYESLCDNPLRIKNNVFAAQNVQVTPLPT